MPSAVEIYLICLCLALPIIGIFHAVIRLLRKKGGIERAINQLLSDFRAKMWMTIGLGLIFFSLYFVVILVSQLLIDKGNGLALMDAARRMPSLFINLGLLLFATLSLLIYLARMIIKYFYTISEK